MAVIWTLSVICFISQLSLVASGIQPKITSLQSVIRVNGSSDVTLTCIVEKTSEDEAALFWKFKGQRIRSGGNRKITKHHLDKKRVNFTLEIKNVSEHDVGDYKCKLRGRDFGKTKVVEDKIQLRLLRVDKVSAGEWPRGTYALPMPLSGCPQSTGFEWSTGFIRQDTENSNPQTSSVKSVHLKGTWFQATVQQHFCVKTESFGTADWPAGNYCINKKIHCPKGFSEGWIKWDDEDIKNDNSISGVLPDGSYNMDTTLYFCCRSDGSVDSPMNLPTSKPFFLVKQSSRCQAVEGMRVREEWVFWDCEDKDNKNRGFGALPAVDISKDIKMFYCYYFQ